MTPTELRERMAALPEPVTDKKPPYWEYWRHELWERITKGEDPFGFMSWPCIGHTMLIRHWPDTAKSELGDIVWQQRTRGIPDGDWDWAIMPPMQFQPPDHVAPYIIPYSQNLTHQLYHLHLWQKETGKQIADLSTIVEVGGGYGAMALVCRRLGFRGAYFILDLPEFLLLQQFFLSHTLEPEQEEQTYYVAPSLSLPGIVTERPQGSDLMIACYSLSEMPFEERKQILQAWPARNYLFLYSRQWEDYDNLAWFTSRFPNGKHWQSPYLPNGNIYHVVSGNA